ncbi:hypothetical protein BST61_g10843 [Cercospora zeina]
MLQDDMSNLIAVVLSSSPLAVTSIGYSATIPLRGPDWLANDEGSTKEDFRRLAGRVTMDDFCHWTSPQRRLRQMRTIFVWYFRAGEAYTLLTSRDSTVGRAFLGLPCSPGSWPG